MLTINKTMKDGQIILALGGRLDTITAPDLEQAVKALPEDAQSLVLDMENLEYISSAGLRVLLTAHKRMGGREGMKVRNVNETIMEVFELTGFSDVLAIE
ncbi:MAG: STAS domain-containing protein [Clostridia bacterium]|nr:STAS domain-containing protein [Clostridia bacterium]